MTTIHFILILLAFVAAVMAALQLSTPRINLIALALALFLLSLLVTSCAGPRFVKTYDRSKIVKGFTQTTDALADARQYTQDAKDEVRKINRNSSRIDNKAGVILRYWDKAR